MILKTKGWEDHIIMAVANGTYFPACSVICLPSHLLSWAILMVRKNEAIEILEGEAQL